jgi:hypothetical protein
MKRLKTKRATWADDMDRLADHLTAVRGVEGKRYQRSATIRGIEDSLNNLLDEGSLSGSRLPRGRE